MAVAVSILAFLVIVLAFGLLHLSADAHQLRGRLNTIEARQASIDYRLSTSSHPTGRTAREYPETL